MPTSSSSSSSSISSSSSSSYAKFVPSTITIVDGNFEILAQTTTNYFLINSGIAYDGYGNRLYKRDRTYTQLTFPSTLSSDANGDYGFLCVRRYNKYAYFDFITDPLYHLPKATKFKPQVEFYISATVYTTIIDGQSFYYAPVDSDDVIEGLVIGKVYKNAVYQPNIFFRSPNIATRNGVYRGVKGYNIY